jgi:hypothetical protein
MHAPGDHHFSANASRFSSAGGRIVEDKVPARNLQRPHHAAIVARPLLDRLQQCRVSISCGRQHERRDVQPPERWDSGVRPQLLQGRYPAHSGTPGMQKATQPITEAADSGGGQFLKVPLPQAAPLPSGVLHHVQTTVASLCSLALSTRLPCQRWIRTKYAAEQHLDDSCSTDLLLIRGCTAFIRYSSSLQTSQTPSFHRHGVS